MGKMHVTVLSAAAAALVLTSCGMLQPSAALESSSRQSVSSAPSAASGTPQKPDNGLFEIPYNSEDSLNPFRSTSRQNLELHTLVYDSLVKLDNDFTPVMSVASDIEIEGTLCTVTIRNGVVFSNDEYLTADDVKYSLDSIFASSSPYAKRLACIADYTVKDDSTLLITLTRPDVLFINLLDFPIVLYGTAKSERPVGSGRYRYAESEEEEGGVIRLEANPNWYGGAPDTFTELYLTPYSYNDSLIHALKGGVIDFAFTDLVKAQSSTNMGSSPIQVPMTNLVFVGLNGSRGYTATASFRKAISLCIDRTDIVSQAFLSRASASSTPFNPNMYATAELANQLDADTQAANSILDALGYTTRDEEGYRLHGTQRVALNLLINTENFYRTQTAKLVKENLAAIGVDCVIVEKNSAAFLTAVQSGDFEMYIAETKLFANNDLSPFLQQGGALSFGLATGGLFAQYTSVQAGQTGYDYFCTQFLEQSPFIPLVFRNGVSFFSRTMAYNVRSSASDIFFNIEDWRYAS